MVTVRRMWAVWIEERAEADSRVRDGPYWNSRNAAQVLPRRGEVVQGREAAQLHCRGGAFLPSALPPFAAHPLHRQKPSAVVWDGLCMASWVSCTRQCVPQVVSVEKGKRVGR